MLLKKGEYCDVLIIIITEDFSLKDDFIYRRRYDYKLLLLACGLHNHIFAISHNNQLHVF